MCVCRDLGRGGLIAGWPLAGCLRVVCGRGGTRQAASRRPACGLPRSGALHGSPHWRVHQEGKKGGKSLSTRFGCDLASIPLTAVRSCMSVKATGLPRGESRYWRALAERLPAFPAGFGVLIPVVDIEKDDGCVLCWRDAVGARRGHKIRRYTAHRSTEPGSAGPP